MVKLKWVFLILVWGLLFQCSVFKKEEKDNTARNLAFLTLLQDKSCRIGEYTFIVKEGSVSCSEDTIEGSGLLLATKEKEEPSIEVKIKLKEDDSLFAFYGASDEDLKTNGSGFRFSKNSAKAFHFDGTPGGVDMPDIFKPAVNIEKTVCLEIHSNETPPHLLAWSSNCPNPPNSNPTFNSEDSGSEPGGTSANKGERWGFELKNSKIILKVNDEKIYRE